MVQASLGQAGQPVGAHDLIQIADKMMIETCRKPTQVGNYSTVSLLCHIVLLCIKVHHATCEHVASDKITFAYAAFMLFNIYSSTNATCSVPTGYAETACMQLSKGQPPVTCQNLRWEGPLKTAFICPQLNS